MRKRLLFFLISVSLFAPITAATPQKLLARYFDNLKKIVTMKARIVLQIKRGDNFSYMKGDFLSKGIKLRMRMPPPFDFILVSNGRKAFFYLKAENTVYMYAPDQFPKEYGNPLEEQKESLDRIGNLTAAGYGYIGWKKLAIYEGVPKGADQFVSKIRIWVDEASGLLYRMESVDLHGKLVSRTEMQKYREIDGIWINLQTQSWTQADRVTMESTTEYQNLQLNLPLEDAEFEFPIPEGARIKDLTEMIQRNQKPPAK